MSTGDKEMTPAGLAASLGTPVFVFGKDEVGVGVPVYKSPSDNLNVGLGVSTNIGKYVPPNYEVGINLTIDL